jgi:hypothetical protein
MVVSGVCLLIFAYMIEKITRELYVYQAIGFSGMFITAFSSFVFAFDSFRRLRKCIENHDRLGISRKQVALNIAVFLMSTLSLGVLMGSVVKASTPQTNHSIIAKTNIMILMIRLDGLCLILVTISSIPIVYIVNSLLNKAIKDSN